MSAFTPATFCITSLHANAFIKKSHRPPTKKKFDRSKNCRTSISITPSVYMVVCYSVAAFCFSNIEVFPIKTVFHIRLLSLPIIN
jgi:hypothetical protein